MSYQIDCGIWSAVFAVPVAVVDEHIRMCSPLSLKVLLVMLRHSGQPCDLPFLSAQLGLSPGDIADALGYWVGAGIVRDDAQPLPTRPDLPAPAASPPQPTTHPPVAEQPAAAIRESEGPGGQRILTMSARPRISREDIAQMTQQHPTLGMLLREAQEILGTPLSAVDSEILAAMFSYYGFAPDVILMLLQYCVQTGRSNMNSVEKLAASWQEREITTHERVEQEIMRLSQNSENEKTVLRAFALHNRGLVTREKEFVEKWFALGLDERLIVLACERSVENTGKASFAYADKILTSWKAKGINTVHAAVEELSSTRPTAPTQNKSAQTAGSSIDKDDLAALLQQQFD